MVQVIKPGKKFPGNFFIKALDKLHTLCYNKGTKEKEIKDMYFYEIKNIKTQATAETIAKNFQTACRALGWRPQDCKCIWKASPENGYEG